MKIVIAMDSFKGSCSAHAACAAVTTGIRRVCPEVELVEIPLSDGGEGLLAILANNPQFSGASSYGLGEQVRTALDRGATEIVIGLGGSATNDGGLGFAQALGAIFWLKDGSRLERPGCGNDLAQLAHVDLSGLDLRLQTVPVVASCDVTNPLLGPRGATYVYGPQKGATSEALAELEGGMTHYAGLMAQATGRDVSNVPGAGAAGGMGAALLWYCHGQLKPGTGLVLDLLNARDHLQDAALVLVGEGRMDSQSAWGKAPVGMATMAAEYRLPVIALCGGRDDSSRKLYQHNITAMWSLCPRPMSLEQAMRDSEILLADTAENAFRTFQAGMAVQQDLVSLSRNHKVNAC